MDIFRSRHFFMLPPLFKAMSRSKEGYGRLDTGMHFIEQGLMFEMRRKITFVLPITRFSVIDIAYNIGKPVFLYQLEFAIKLLAWGYGQSTSEV